ncbi:MAG: glycosyltransferase family 2 protein, partial [bacterium]|nr:glycosyltransferase family 2 protein [bacterium]
RLGLNPTTLGGNCVYRLKALTQVGGFPPGAFSEDIEVSLAISAKGWKTRFVEGAVADADTATSLSRYWNQHLRWARGLYRSTRLVRGLEGVAVTLGYADRIVFLAITILALLGKVSVFWPLLYVAVPLLAIMVAIARARAGWWMGLRVVASLPMFFVDLVGALVATLGGAVGLPLPWITGGEKTR